MKTEALVRIEAMNTLIAALGPRETFDYTEWRRKLWSEKSIEEIHALATEREINRI